MEHPPIKIICPNKELIEVHFEDCAVAIPGQLCRNYFAAEPKNLYWIAPKERAKQALTEEEQNRLMTQLDQYYGGAADRVLFLTEDVKSLSRALALQVYRKTQSRRNAEKLFKKAFPSLPPAFLEDCLADDTARILAGAVKAGTLTRQKAKRIWKRAYPWRPLESFFDLMLFVAGD